MMVVMVGVRRFTVCPFERGREARKGAAAGQMAAWLPESVVVHCKGGTVRARISRRLAEGTSLGMGPRGPDRVKPRLPAAGRTGTGCDVRRRDPSLQRA